LNVAHLLDTSVAVYLRDRNDALLAHLAGLDQRPALSVVTLVELEGGVHGRPEHSAMRRGRVQEMVRQMEVLPFEESCVSAYGAIVEAAGFSRRKVIDRMIAATAIVHELTLITLNGADFADIPHLELEVWPTP
jgi:tRNA(fMet)-specific endonuclease VapC